MEYFIIVTVIVAALAFAVWRTLKTLDVARGGKDTGGCHTCPANRRPAAGNDQ
jgi:hypothetical protein